MYLVVERVYASIFSSTGVISPWPSVCLSVTHFTQKVLVGSSPNFTNKTRTWSRPLFHFLTRSSKLITTAAILIFSLRLLLKKHKWYRHGVFTITPKFYLCQKWSDLNEIWYVGTYRIPEWFNATFVFEKKNPRWPPWRHNCRMSKWLNLLEILYKCSHWCTYSDYVVLTLIENPIRPPLRPF